MEFNELSLQDLEYNFFGNKLEKLPENEKNEYMSMYLLYRKLFTNYIIDVLNLKEIDEKIKKSEFKFISVTEEEKDIYQFFVNNDLDYFYIRNDIYLEQLSSEEIKFLKSILNENVMLNQNVKEFIESTYKKAIFNNSLNNGSFCTVFYGPETMNYSAPNNALVLGFRYDSFNKNNLNEEMYIKNNENQHLLLQKIFEEITSNAQSKLEIPCSIIEYNEFSVQRKSMSKHY